MLRNAPSWEKISFQLGHFPFLTGNLNLGVFVIFPFFVLICDGYSPYNVPDDETKISDKYSVYKLLLYNFCLLYGILSLGFPLVCGNPDAVEQFGCSVENAATANDDEWQ